MIVEIKFHEDIWFWYQQSETENIQDWEIVQWLDDVWRAEDEMHISMAESFVEYFQGNGREVELVEAHYKRLLTEQDLEYWRKKK